MPIWMRSREPFSNAENDIYLHWKTASPDLRHWRNFLYDYSLNPELGKALSDYARSLNSLF
jgi:hypothetical protein